MKRKTLAAKIIILALVLALVLGASSILAAGREEREWYNEGYSVGFEDGWDQASLEYGEKIEQERESARNQIEILNYEIDEQKKISKKNERVSVIMFIVLVPSIFTSITAIVKERTEVNQK